MPSSYASYLDKIDVISVAMLCNPLEGLHKNSYAKLWSHLWKLLPRAKRNCCIASEGTPFICLTYGTEEMVREKQSILSKKNITLGSQQGECHCLNPASSNSIASVPCWAQHRLPNVKCPTETNKGRIIWSWNSRQCNQKAAFSPLIHLRSGTVLPSFFLPKSTHWKFKILK